MRQILVYPTTLCCVLVLSQLPLSALALPSFKKLLPRSLFRRPKYYYTPLLFFTAPPGTVPECDAMEQVVRRVEKDLDVTVERLDIMRDPASEAVLTAILGPNVGATPPLLYHRESRQVIHVPQRPVKKSKEASAAAAASKQQRNVVPIDAERVRAWAKGRYLFPSSSSLTPAMSGTAIAAPQGGSSLANRNVDDEDEQLLMEQAEQMAEMSLTPEQRLGKRRMEERTQAKSSAKEAAAAVR